MYCFAIKICFLGIFIFTPCAATQCVSAALKDTEPLLVKIEVKIILNCDMFTFMLFDLLCALGHSSVQRRGELHDRREQEIGRRRDRHR